MKNVCVSDNSINNHHQRRMKKVDNKWLHNEATHSQLRHLHRYLNCVEKHANCHTEAAKVTNGKTYETALQRLNNSMSNLNLISDEIALEIFKRAISFRNMDYYLNEYELPHAS
jgi:hypothetical protein